MSHNLHEVIRKSLEMWKMGENEALIWGNLCYNIDTCEKVQYVHREPDGIIKICKQ